MLIKIGGEIISPTFAELGAKLHTWVWRKPYLRGQLAKDLSVLEVIKYGLMRINTIPEFPDYTKTDELRDILLSISQGAGTVKNKRLKEIKDKLLCYSGKVGQLNVNMNSLDALKLLGQDSTSRIIKEIDEITAKVKGEK